MPDGGDSFEDAGPEVDAGPSRASCDVCPFSGGFACVGGECVATCVPGEADTCGFGEHCRFEACLPDVSKACAEVPCTKAQTCVSEYCVLTGSTACERLGDPACGSFEECDVLIGTCVRLPYCEANETCRPGDLGAVCNLRYVTRERLVPEKQLLVCLLGHCRGDTDCPEGKHCVDIGLVHAEVGVCR